MRRAFLACFLLLPVAADACVSCRPRVLHLGFAADYLIDIALMFVSLALAVLLAHFIPWEKLTWPTRKKP